MKYSFTNPRRASHGWTLLLMILLVTLPGVAKPHNSARMGASSKPTRIRFMRGAVSAQVRGALVKQNGSESFFVIKANAGDHMIVNFIPVTPGLLTGGEVIAPSGAQDGQHGGIIFNSDLKESGDYTIRVGLNLMGTERRTGEFILEVVITPPYLKS